MKIKQIVSFCENLFFPPVCIACHSVMRADTSFLMCRICTEKWESAKSGLRARYHGVPAVPIEIECNNGLRESYIASLVNYRQLALEPGYSVQKRLIFELKRHDFKSLVRFLSEELVSLIDETMSGVSKLDTYLMVSVPRSPINLVATANDGVRAVAKECAQIIGIEYADVFAKSFFAKEQKLLNAKQRKENIKSSLFLKKNASAGIRGRKIILVDDVITTGSSVHEAARLLFDVGHAAGVFIYSIAQNSELLIRK